VTAPGNKQLVNGVF